MVNDCSYELWESRKTPVKITTIFFVKMGTQKINNGIRSPEDKKRKQSGFAANAD